MSNENENQLPTIADDLVVTKYKMAAEIVNRKSSLIHKISMVWCSIQAIVTSSVLNLILTGVLKEIVNGCAEGQSVRELCVKADTLLAEETGKAFKKDKKVQKGNHFINSSQVLFTPIILKIIYVIILHHNA